MTNATRPIALTIAGSDPSGGAGIQADLKTFTALGAYGASVITALTVQNTLGVTNVLKITPDFIIEQFDSVASDLDIAAIKTGMLADVATVEAVCQCLARARRANPEIAIVVDPVMVATSGDRLIDDDAIAAVRTKLAPLATVITPNLPEAAALLSTEAVETDQQMREQALALSNMTGAAVLLKGGHAESGRAATDFLISDQVTTTFTKPRISTNNTHGTGCTLSAAITAALALKHDLVASITIAKDYTWNALQAGANQHIGAGNGPIDHSFSVRF